MELISSFTSILILSLCLHCSNAATKTKANKLLDVDCTDQAAMENSTVMDASNLEMYAQTLRQIDQLHHTDKCDPNLDQRIFDKIWAVEKGVVFTYGWLHQLKCGMKRTCPGGRNMMCDPNRKRCVCQPNSFWLPLSMEERNDPDLNMNKGRCYLKVGMKCEADQSHVKKKMERLVCVEGSKCMEVVISKETQKKEMRCHCERVDNSSGTPALVDDCVRAMMRQERQLKRLVSTAKEMKWKSYGENCTLKGAIDTRVHTLRSIDVKLNNDWWNQKAEAIYKNGSSQRCDFTKNLNCNSSGQCDCKPYYAWKNVGAKDGGIEGQCVGNEGAFCEIRFWAEADTVGLQTRCNTNLSCIVVSHPDNLKEYHVCCYIGDHKYLKTLSYANFHMCELEGPDEGYEDATMTHDPLMEDEDDEDGDDESGGKRFGHEINTFCFALIMVLLMQ